MSRRKGDEEARKRVLESSDEPLSASRIRLNITEQRRERESERERQWEREKENEVQETKKGK